MKLKIGLLLIVICIIINTSQQQTPCIIRDDASFNTFIAVLKFNNQNMTCDELSNILIKEEQTFIQNQVFKLDQVLKIIEILYNEDKIQLFLDIFKNRIPNFNADELINLLDSYDETEYDLVQYLILILGQNLSNLILESQTVQQEQMTEQITKITYQVDASLVYSQFFSTCVVYTQKDYEGDKNIFGSTYWIKNRILFIIDQSGSMANTYTFNGVTQNRLEHIKDLMIEQIDELEDGQQFNILLFQSTSNFYKSQYIVVSDQTKDEAKNWVQTVGITGGTDVYQALQTAFQSPDLYGTLFLMCDGDVNIPVSDTEYYLDQLQQLNTNRNETVVINTMSFIQGESQELKRISEVSGGFYKSVG